MAKKSKRSKSSGGETAVAMPGGDRRDVCIRKIANGYVLTESGVRAGKYFSRETFTPRQPKINITPAKTT